VTVSSARAGGHEHTHGHPHGQEHPHGGGGTPAAVSPVELRDRLHAHGLRATPQRELVLAAVSRLDHATPEAVWAEVQLADPGVNVSTVYRTLELFEKLGLIRHTHLGRGAATYHAGFESAHLHLVCEQCGRIAEADVDVAEGLVGRLRASYGFSPDVEHMGIAGVCADCARRQP
jgi:Fur family transcriptional regulator, ferric uptake regulator